MPSGFFSAFTRIGSTLKGLISPSSGDKRKRGEEADQRSRMQPSHAPPAQEPTQTYEPVGLNDPGEKFKASAKTVPGETRTPSLLKHGCGTLDNTQAFPPSLAASCQILKQQVGLSQDFSRVQVKEDPVLSISQPLPANNLKGPRYPSFQFTPAPPSSSSYRKPLNRKFPSSTPAPPPPSQPVAPISRMRHKVTLPLPLPLTTSSKLHTSQQQHQVQRRREYGRSIEIERRMAETRGMDHNTFQKLLNEVQNDLTLSRQSPLVSSTKDESSGGVMDDLERAKKARERHRQLDEEQSSLDTVGMAQRMSLGLSLKEAVKPLEAASRMQEVSLQAALKWESEASMASEDRDRLDREGHIERRASLAGVYSLAKDKLHERDVMRARAREEERQRAEQEERRRAEAKDRAAKEVAEVALRMAQAAAKPQGKPVPPPPVKPKPQVDEIVLLDSDAEVSEELDSVGAAVSNKRIITANLHRSIASFGPHRPSFTRCARMALAARHARHRPRNLSRSSRRERFGPMPLWAPWRFLTRVCCLVTQVYQRLFDSLMNGNGLRRLMSKRRLVYSRRRRHAHGNVFSRIYQSVSKALGHDMIDLTLDDDLQLEQEVDDEVVEVVDDEEDDGFMVTNNNRASWNIVFDRPEAKESKVLVDFRQLTVTRKQLECMDHGTWLNDEAINTYAVLMQERDTLMKRNPPSHLPNRPPKCSFFSSFFLTQLFMNDNIYGYKAVKKWTIPKKIALNGLDLEGYSSVFNLDLLLFPANINNAHWTHAVIDLKKQELVYYDSMGGRRPDILEHLAHWLEDESRDKRGVEIDCSKWRRVFPKDIPRQANGFDCGLFVLMYADRLGMGLPFEFHQRHMEDIRIKVLHRLLAKRVPLWPTFNMAMEE